jgi:hypothetical protein
MTDDDQDEILFDWRLVRDAARAGESGRRPDGDRADRADGDGRRRSPSGKSARPKTQLIPFPLGRRRAFVERLAEQVIARPAAAGEAHLLQQIRRQGEILRRKGISEKLIERELRALTAAVRAELWRLLLGSGA